MKTITRTMPVRLLAVLLAALLSGCRPEQLPELPSLPGLPEELRQLPEVLEKLELPDLSDITLPSLDTLPGLQAPADGIVFSGPTERSVNAGESVPGTGIVFTGVEEGTALFQIEGMESPKRVGDSLDFDGAWPTISGSLYSVRYRIYLIGETSVRLAGVQQLMIPGLAPEQAVIPEATKEDAAVLRFPFTDGVEVGGDTIHGTTWGYLGRFDRGAHLTGLSESQYPYRDVGDSIVWQGWLREGVAAEYDLRTLAYGAESLRVGGTVTLHIVAP